MNRRTFLASLATVALGSGCGRRTGRETDLLVYGGGAAGLCAAIQAARMGIRVLVAEPSVWIGGKLTAAGVSALDGNRDGLGGGLVHEFREELAAHYGSYEALFTGWISRYCYEPRVGLAILERMVTAEPGLTVLRQADVVGYRRDGDRRVATVRGADGSDNDWSCSVFMDATEYGDGLRLAGMPYRLGREARDEYRESAAPERADLEMQDLTWVATLVEDPGATLAGPGESQTDWSRFVCSTLLDCPDPDPARLNHTIHSWERFITYAKLPGGKVLLNWPHHANDWPVSVAFFEDRVYRRTQFDAARRHTLSFVDYVRARLGHPEWRIAVNEYPTADGLPLIPYMRESRRLVTHRPMTQDDVVPVGGRARAPWIPDAVAVGDYYLDHHHAKNHFPPGERLVEDYPDNAPFQIPLRVALAEDDERFLAAEKNISVTHIVNGCTRLQPAVMLMGQALGAASALAVRGGTTPGDVDIARVQQVLVDGGCQVWPVYDVPTGHPLFAAVQRLALAGVLTDEDPMDLDLAAPADADVARTWMTRAGWKDAVSPEVRGPLGAGDLRLSVPENRGPVTRGTLVAALDRALEK